MARGNRNYNRGGRRSGRRASRKNGNNPFGLSRRQRRDLNRGTLSYSEWLKAQKNQNQKNVNRRGITEKIKRGQVKILEVLEKMATKLDDILKLFVKEDKREKEKEQEKKHSSLGRKIWDSTGRKLDKAGNAVVGGLGALGLASAMLGGDEVLMEERTDGDEEPKPLPEGVQVINGAKIYIGPGVNLNGMNQDFLKRFTDAVREYQEEHGGNIVRINSGYRSLAQQKAIYDKDKAEHGGKATKSAPPGRSMHEYGFALDMNTPEADAMDALGLLKKHGLNRSEMHPKGWIEGNPLVETWHIEDDKVRGLKKKLREEGANSFFATNMRKGLNPETGLPDEATVALADEIAQTVFENQVAEALEEAAAQAQENESRVAKLAQGGMVEAIAGEAGPELVLPMDQRGGEILANAVKSAFREMAGARNRKSSVQKFKMFFEGRFLPELRKQMGKN